MPLGFTDDTIRVPKFQDTGQRRKLRQSFAPERSLRWPWLVIALVLIIALARPIDLSGGTRALQRSTQAQELIKLGR